MNFHHQKRKLFAFSFLTGLRLTSAVWVVLLVSRGFSLWQIGLAEGVFHIVSLLCEIPSGMAADLLGRRRTLAVSGLLGAVSALCMAFASNFAGILFGMAFSALSYNFTSGTEEAILYDSLLAAGRAEDYVAVDAVSCQLSYLSAALSDLASFLSGVLHYTGFYLADGAVSLARTAVALLIKEPLVTEQQRRRDKNPFAALPARFRAHVSCCVRFLAGNGRVARLIFSDAVVSLPSYLTLMFLQERLRELGLPTIWLGLPLLGISAAAILGTEIGKHLRPRRLAPLYALCALLVGGGVAAAGLLPVYPAVAGAMVSSAAMQIWYLHVQKALNEAYPSDQRATLVSVNSMAYSILMIAASPLTGWIGDAAGSAGAGLAVLGAAVGLTALPAIFKKA